VSHSTSSRIILNIRALDIFRGRKSGLSLKGIHVAHVIIDGVVDSPPTRYSGYLAETPVSRSTSSRFMFANRSELRTLKKKYLQPIEHVDKLVKFGGLDVLSIACRRFTTSTVVFWCSGCPPPPEKNLSTILGSESAERNRIRLRGHSALISFADPDLAF
jgi:hypothetical protein